MIEVRKTTERAKDEALARSAPRASKRGTIRVASERCEGESCERPAFDRRWRTVIAGECKRGCLGLKQGVGQADDGADDELLHTSSIDEDHDAHQHEAPCHVRSTTALEEHTTAIDERCELKGEGLRPCSSST